MTRIPGMEHMLTRATRMLESNPGLLLLSRSPLYNDEPQLFTYSAEYTVHLPQDNQGHEQGRELAFGASFNQETALLRAIGEGVERHCLFNHKVELEAKGASHMLQGCRYLDAASISPFSPDQLSRPEFEQFQITGDSTFGWTKGISLVDRETLLIPAQMVTYQYDYPPDEPTIMPQLSTGVAAGNSLEGAIYRAICEVVERDSFLICYLNELSIPAVDMKTPQLGNVTQILRAYERYCLELVVLDATTDVNIPSYIAITLDRTGLGPAVSVGLKAGFDPIASICGAIEESLMTRSWIRDRMAYTDVSSGADSTVQTIEQRALYWAPVDAIERLNFWLRDVHYEPVCSSEIAKSARLATAVSRLTARQMDAVYVDITEPVAHPCFRVVRVIIPDLQPLYLDERYPYHGTKRLLEAPINMGRLKSPKREVDLNPFPHPFL